MGTQRLQALQGNVSWRDSSVMLWSLSGQMQAGKKLRSPPQQMKKHRLFQAKACLVNSVYGTCIPRSLVYVHNAPKVVPGGVIGSFSLYRFSLPPPPHYTVYQVSPFQSFGKHQALNRNEEIWLPWPKITLHWRRYSLGELLGVLEDPKSICGEHIMAFLCYNPKTEPVERNL